MSKSEENDLASFEEEITPVWSFPDRGDWATHNPTYRGNFAPQIPRNIIIKYSKEGDTVLDPMVGGGTTLIECKLLGRNGIGKDINPKAIERTKESLKFKSKLKTKQITAVGDVRDLKGIKDNSIDLIITHPPYLDIIKYSEKKSESDLSWISGIKKFCDEFEKGIKEFWRVLKPDHYCAILIGDTRKATHYIPLSYYVWQRFLDAGFALKEDIIKAQHNCQSTPAWIGQAKKYGIYLIMHEHLYVFRKPKDDENLSRIRYSLKL